MSPAGRRPTHTAAMREGRARRFSSVRRRFVIATAALLGLGVPQAVFAQVQRVPFSGGTDGSLLQIFASGLATLLSRSLESVEVYHAASAGSTENLARVGSAGADFGIVFAGDLYRHIRQRDEAGDTTDPDVRVVSGLFGVAAHLVVRAESAISTVDQLAGRELAVGPAGSAAAASAQHVLDSLGLWERITPHFASTSQGASWLTDGRVDALWVLDSVPSTAVIHAAASRRVRLLPLWEAAQASPLLNDHPYYVRTSIGAGTYPDVEREVATIRDTALWVAGRHVADDLVYQALDAVYSEPGLQAMRLIDHAAASMSADEALAGVVMPIHEGARRYWRERGLALPDALR
jgi:TRAP transporter TAXI family solute receptor